MPFTFKGDVADALGYTPKYYNYLTGQYSTYDPAIDNPLTAGDMSGWGISPGWEPDFTDPSDLAYQSLDDLLYGGYGDWSDLAGGYGNDVMETDDYGDNMPTEGWNEGVGTFLEPYEPDFTNPNDPAAQSLYDMLYPSSPAPAARPPAARPAGNARQSTNALPPQGLTDAQIAANRWAIGGYNPYGGARGGYYGNYDPANLFNSQYSAWLNSSDYARQRGLNLGSQLQNAMGQMGNLLQANANRQLARDQLASQQAIVKMQTDALKAQNDSKNALLSALIGKMGGTGTGTGQTGYGTAFGGLTLYNQGTAFGGGTPGTGLTYQPGQVWNATSQAQLAGKLGNVASGAAKNIGGFGANNPFGRSYTNAATNAGYTTQRAGQEADMRGTLAAQAQQVKSADELQRLLNSMYASGLNQNMQQQSLQAKLLGGFA